MIEDNTATVRIAESERQFILVQFILQIFEHFWGCGYNVSFSGL